MLIKFKLYQIVMNTQEVQSQENMSNQTFCHSSPIQVNLIPNAKFIIRCPQCSKEQSLFQSDGEWKVFMGDHYHQDGKLIFVASKDGYGYGYRCVECPFGHPIALYSNAAPNKLQGSVSLIEL